MVVEFKIAQTAALPKKKRSAPLKDPAVPMAGACLTSQESKESPSAVHNSIVAGPCPDLACEMDDPLQTRANVRCGPLAGFSTGTVDRAADLRGRVCRRNGNCAVVRPRNLIRFNVIASVT